MKLDDEHRSSRFLDAFGSIIELIDGQVPGLSLPTERISALLSLLYNEAEYVVAPPGASPPRGSGLHLVGDD